MKDSKGLVAIGISGQNNGNPYAFVMASPATLSTQSVYAIGNRVMVGIGNPDYVAKLGVAFGELRHYDDSSASFCSLDDLTNRWLPAFVDINPPSGDTDLLLMGPDKKGNTALEKVRLKPNRTCQQIQEQGSLNIRYAGVDDDQYIDFLKSLSNYGAAANFDGAFRFAAVFMKHFGVTEDKVQFGLGYNGDSGIETVISFPSDTEFASQDYHLGHLRKSLPQAFGPIALSALISAANNNRKDFEAILIELADSMKTPV